MKIAVGQFEAAASSSLLFSPSLGRRCFGVTTSSRAVTGKIGAKTRQSLGGHGPSFTRAAVIERISLLRKIDAKLSYRFSHAYDLPRRRISNTIWSRWSWKCEPHSFLRAWLQLFLHQESRPRERERERERNKNRRPLATLHSSRTPE